MTREERAAYASILGAMTCDAAVTLAYNDLGVSPERMRRDLRTLRAHVDRAVLGRRFHRLPVACRSSFWAIPEKVDAHPHWHLGWRLAVSPGSNVAPSYRVETLDAILNQEGVWRKLAPRGSVDVKPYKTGWADYAAKALQLENDIVTSADFD